MNPFDLIGNDVEDLSQLLIAAEQQQKVVAATKKEQVQAKPAVVASQAIKPSAKHSTKPLHTSQAVSSSLTVREPRAEPTRGGGRGGGGRGYSRGRGSGGYNQESYRNENSYNSGISAGQGPRKDGEAGKSGERRPYAGPRGPYRGGRRGGFGNATGRGNEFKREGSGCGNSRSPTDVIFQVTEDVVDENVKSSGNVKPVGEEDSADPSKETPVDVPEEKEEMTLEEYEKVMEEKRKALQAPKTEGRKIDAKEFESMQQISNKKDNHDIFIKLGSEKDKKKATVGKDAKAKKYVSIDEFLKPDEKEKYQCHGTHGMADAEDPSQLLIAAEQQQKVVAATKKEQVQGKPAVVASQAIKPSAAKLSTKLLPITQAALTVTKARAESTLGGGSGGGYNQGSYRNENSYNGGISAGQGPREDGEAGKSVVRRPYAGPGCPYRGGRRGGFGNETGSGNEFKREGSARGNSGSPTDEISQVTEDVVDENEKSSGDVKPVGEEDPSKETPVNVPEEKEVDSGMVFDWTADNRFISPPVRHQQRTNSCWAIATCTAIEMLYNIHSKTFLATKFQTCHDYVPSYIFLSHQNLIDSLSPIRDEDVDYKTKLMLHCTIDAHEIVEKRGVYFLKDCPSIFRKKNENEFSIEKDELLAKKVVKISIAGVGEVEDATLDEKKNFKRQYYERLEKAIRKQPITITVPQMIETTPASEDNIIRRPRKLSAVEKKEWERGHSVVAVGFGKIRETKFVKFLNSFGKQWGRDGYARVAMNLVEFGIYPVGTVM